MMNTKRRFVGARMDEAIYSRVMAVAAKQKTSPRSVMEQLIERGLPHLELQWEVNSRLPSDNERKTLEIVTRAPAARVARASRPI